MANRLTKGKALVGSIDIQGALTVNGAPVSGGGGGLVGPELVYAMAQHPDDQWATEVWAVGMGGSKTIYDNHYENDGWKQQNFVTGNNMQVGERYEVTLAEYWGYLPDGMTQAWVNCNTSWQWAGHTFYGVVIFDFMYGRNTLRVGYYGTATYGMQDRFRFTFKKKG